MRMTNDELKSAYQDRLKPSLAVAQIIRRLDDDRAQIMLALQHNPDNPLSKMHDPPVDAHFDAIRSNDGEMQRLIADYQAHPMPSSPRC